MSAEKIINSDKQNFTSLSTPEASKKILPNRVDINDLLARVRDEKKKENKINIVFFSLFASVVFIFGIVLSL